VPEAPRSSSWLASPKVWLVLAIVFGLFGAFDVVEGVLVVGLRFRLFVGIVFVAAALFYAWQYARQRNAARG